MRAVVFNGPDAGIEVTEWPEPEPGPGQVKVRVLACGVCRTDLHLVDGELDTCDLPVVPGHQIVGEVTAAGEGANRFAFGERIGIPWLGWACGECAHCRAGRENLCERARFTGCNLDGGYAEHAVADERFCLAVPGEAGDDLHVAPLLCAGLIGYRALRMCGDAERVGLYGFGASAHIICQIAAHQGREVAAFTRPGDVAGQSFARGLGAAWAGGSDEPPPEALDAAIIFAPVGALVPVALRAVDRGGAVVCAGIHMSEIPAFPYELLWGERQLRSVANLTRADGVELMAIVAEVRPRTEISAYPLEAAGTALDDLRSGSLSGAAVLDLR